MNTSNGPSALISVLDWGLGHATRCIPIIRALKKRGFNVVIATDGAPMAMLKKEFPNTEFLQLRGYNIRYASQKAFSLASILRQLPKIISLINFEKKWIKVLLKERHFDVIISDNRPGFYHPEVKSIYLTHQLNIQTGNNFLNRIANFIHKRITSPFNECWVPDSPDHLLTGKLSLTNDHLPIKFIGPLSQFNNINGNQSPIKNIDLLFVLSGPEPQRSIFENKILKSLETYSGSAVVVRGLPLIQNTLQHSSKNITLINYASAEELFHLLQRAKWIIGRSGYTSVMDYSYLKVKALFVPTPGQTEQEYLAIHLSQACLFPYLNQDNFNLQTAINMLETWQFNQCFPCFDKYKTEINRLFGSLKN